MALKFVHAFLLVFLVHISVSVGLMCIERERQALLSLKQGFVDEPGRLSSWGSGEDQYECCKWKGIVCNNRSGHVLELDLHNKGEFYAGLQGTISPSLAELRHLNYLDLSSNYFNASLQIPRFTGSLTQLKYLNLSNSFGRGNVPEEFGNLFHLQYLDLHSNGLDGKFPSQLLNLSHLKYLDLQGNNFYGVIPHRLGNLSCLQHLYLSFNLRTNLEWVSYLSSSLSTLSLHSIDLSNANNWPQLPSDLPLLRELTLSGCNLTHRAPLSISNMNISRVLAFIDISYNNLMSSIFGWLLNFKNSLAVLNLSNNHIRDVIPDVIGNFSSLQVLQLKENLLLHGMPESLWDICSLHELRLYGNKLSGQLHDFVPTSPFCAQKSLKILDLGSNQITGTMPDLSQLSSLQELDLRLNKINGALTESIGKLSNLEILEVEYNSLEGVITEAHFRDLSKLRILNLAFNQISGTMPDLSQLSSLQELDLSHNNISGVLTESIGKLSNLEAIYIYENSLEGVVTETHFRDLSKLRILDLAFNQIAGTIPDLSQLSSLQELYLGGNNISGALTESIGKLSNLKALYIFYNSLEGVVTEAHFKDLFKLEILDLAFNKLTLNISAEWVPPFQLEHILLCSCKVGPHFPMWLQTQKHYKLLDMSGCKISETIPIGFWNSLPHSLEYFYLSHNHMGGEIPNLQVKFNGNLDIDLSSNLFRGPIPSFLATANALRLNDNKFTDLTSLLCTNKANKIAFLDLSNNHLSEIPDCWQNLKSLSYLHLGNNNIVGKIPTSMCSLTNIEQIYFRNNNLTGEISLSLSNWEKLVVFDVSHNKLSGPVPPWIGDKLKKLKVLILKSNQFYGNLPTNICLLASLQILDLSLNNISGNIPRCLNKLTAMTDQINPNATISIEYMKASSPNGSEYQDYNASELLMWKGREFEYRSILGYMRIIDLSNNNLVGEIPREIMNLAGLVSLNISRNKLSGKIPSTIGQLKSLNVLDLSRNFLSGAIPSSLSDLHFLGMLNLSYNNLSGKIPVGTQIQSFESTSFMGNTELCGAPLPKQCPDELINEGQHDRNDRDGNQILDHGMYISFTFGFIVGFWGVCGSLCLNESWRYSYFKFFNDTYNALYVLMAVNITRLQRRFNGFKERFKEYLST